MRRAGAVAVVMVALWSSALWAQEGASKAVGGESEEWGWRAEAERDDSVSEPVRAATVAMGEGRGVTVIQGGMVQKVPYGIDEPVLLVAPLRISAIVLEAGEVVSDYALGDQAHWQVLEMMMGSTPVLGVKALLDPEDSCDKTTSLVITTDRRLYSVLLEVPKCGFEGDVANEMNPQRPYTRLLRFYYPQQLLQKWARRSSRATEEAEVALLEAEDWQGRAVGVPVEELYWGYTPRRGRGPRFPWMPVVFDDGQRTYLRLPAQAREVPAVFERRGGADGIVDFKIAADDRSLMILPGVYDSLVLVLPSGKKRARLEMVRGGAG